MPAYSPQFVAEIINQIEVLIIEADEKSRPLELQPYRGRLFELFAVADRENLVDDDEGPLAADAICRELGDRWGLSRAAQASLAERKTLGGDELAKMRSLWSVMRLWMEWAYAWRRWQEFHSTPHPRD